MCDPTRHVGWNHPLIQQIEAVPDHLAAPALGLPSVQFGEFCVKHKLRHRLIGKTVWTPVAEIRRYIETGQGTEADR